MADIETNELYKNIRNRFGRQRVQANGYRFDFFFEREQRTVLDKLRNDFSPVVDLCCGSGLMIKPLAVEHSNVFGFDFNEEACLGAQTNGVSIIRGDAFSLPFEDNSIGQILNCQFLNQQTDDNTRQFIFEVARVLKPSGRLIMTWRKATSLLHFSAATLFHFVENLQGYTRFPQYTHTFEQLETYVIEAGLQVQHKAVTLPVCVATVSVINPVSHIIGTSNFIIVTKP